MSETSTRTPAAPTRHNQAVRPIDRWVIRKVIAGAGNPPVRVRLWDGEDVYSPPDAVAAVHLKSRAVLKALLVEPELGFGDSYSSGDLEIEGDLVTLVEMAARVAPRKPNLFVRFGKWLYRRGATTLMAARSNIQHHYDLGNEFYRLWLDERMVYTCAYYERPDMTLEEAQFAKMEHVCKKLRLRPGQQVIEAGCGWGSLAMHMARHHGVHVRAFNISREQLDYAWERAKAEGMAGQVEFVMDDYRNITGTCDRFVSVGMLEHVGPENYATLGDVIQRTLRPDGLGLVHSIGRTYPTPLSAWLEKRIFPGAYIPTIREMMSVFEPRFSVLDIENLRMHYAQTLLHWLGRFEASAGQVRAMYDEKFVRSWRMYLASARAGFLSNTVDLFQVVFTPLRNNHIPWTRADIYRAGVARDER